MCHVVVHPSQVRGTAQLRVVDASLFPLIPNGNLNAPTIMTAEKLADDILGHAPPPLPPAVAAAMMATAAAATTPPPQGGGTAGGGGGFAGDDDGKAAAAAAASVLPPRGFWSDPEWRARQRERPPLGVSS